MSGTDGVDLATFLTAAEDASPASAVLTAAGHLHEVIGAELVSFWIADAAGQALLRMPDGERLSTAGTVAGTAWLEQQIQRDDSWWVPVTARGDALGVLEVRLPRDRPEPRDPAAPLGAVAHLLAYVMVANQRHTDEYEIARRSESFELAMEIQRRLLPQAFVCEGGSFTIAGWLEPSSSAGGDTFDYVASRDRLTLSMIDAVGHDVEAAMLATLTVNAMRKGRRDGGDLRDQADAAHAALVRHGDDEDYATGLLMELDLTSLRSGADDHSAGDEDPEAPAAVRARVVNAGHPGPRLVRGGALTRVDLAPDPPFGLDERLAGSFTAHDLDLLPGDRVVLLTDGMYERSAESFDLDGHLLRTARVHPRRAVQAIASAFRDHVGEPEDDATFLILDWHGGSTTRRTSGGSDEST